MPDQLSPCYAGYEHERDRDECDEEPTDRGVSANPELKHQDYDRLPAHFAWREPDISTPDDLGMANV